MQSPEALLGLKALLSVWLPKGSWKEALVSCNMICSLGCLYIFMIFQLTVPKSSAPNERTSQNVQCLLKIMIVFFRLAGSHEAQVSLELSVAKGGFCN